MRHRLAAALLLLCGFLSGIGRNPQGGIVALDNNIFVAMVDPVIDECRTYQEEDNWCWAACIEMLLIYYGDFEIQQTIVSEVFGEPLDRMSTGNEIAEALDGWKDFTVRSLSTKNHQLFINELAKGHPLIVGCDHHAYLMTHLYCTRNPDGTLRPFKAILVNPATASEEVRYWTPFYSKINSIITFHR